jgi:hypothetical protein
MSLSNSEKTTFAELGIVCRRSAVPRGVVTRAKESVLSELDRLGLRKSGKLDAQCTWDNSQKNQPVVNGQQISPIDVMWGEGTLNEMCMWVSVYGDHK